jgi:hypothetical protein
VPLFPCPELSIILVPEVSDMSHVAAAVLPANALAVHTPGTNSAKAPAPTAARQHADRYITSPKVSEQISSRRNRRDRSPDQPGTTRQSWALARHLTRQGGFRRPVRIAHVRGAAACPTVRLGGCMSRCSPSATCSAVGGRVSIRAPMTNGQTGVDNRPSPLRRRACRPKQRFSVWSRPG